MICTHIHTIPAAVMYAYLSPELGHVCMYIYISHGIVGLGLEVQLGWCA